MLKKNNLFVNEWNDSFKNKQNFLFYPNEEIIKFINKYHKKYDPFAKKSKLSPKALDFGFGSGRHIKYLVDNGFFGYGIDISNQAKKLANKFLNLNKIKKKNFKLIINKKDNIINIPSNHIDICISHGTLDSMTLNNAKIVSNEIYKVLKKGSFFYCDLISTEVARVGKKFRGSENQIIVNEDHEKGTIQSFFNVKSIKELFHQFKIIEIYKKKIYRKNLIQDSRYHIILQK